MASSNYLFIEKNSCQLFDSIVLQTFFQLIYSTLNTIILKKIRNNFSKITVLVLFLYFFLLLLPSYHLHLFLAYHSSPVLMLLDRLRSEKPRKVHC